MPARSTRVKSRLVLSRNYAATDEEVSTKGAPTHSCDKGSRSSHVIPSAANDCLMEPLSAARLTRMRRLPNPMSWLSDGRAVDFLPSQTALIFVYRPSDLDAAIRIAMHQVCSLCERDLYYRLCAFRRHCDKRVGTFR